MKRNFSIVLLLLCVVTLLLLVVGCSRKVAPSTTSEVRDSVIVKTVEKFITLPGDTITIEKKIECDPVTLKPKPFKKSEKKGLGKTELELDSNGVLTSTSICDSLLKEREKTIQHLRTSTKTETKIITEYKSHWYDIAARWISGFTILIVGGYAFYKFNKPV